MRVVSSECISPPAHEKTGRERVLTQPAKPGLGFALFRRGIEKVCHLTDHAAVRLHQAHKPDAKVIKPVLQPLEIPCLVLLHGAAIVRPIVHQVSTSRQHIPMEIRGFGFIFQPVRHARFDYFAGIACRFAAPIAEG